jgi:hypothetical protein
MMENAEREETTFTKRDIDVAECVLDVVWLQADGSESGQADD